MSNNLLQAIQLIHTQLNAFASTDSFWDTLDTAFSTGYSQRLAGSIRHDWMANNFLNIPDIEVLDSSTLGNANGTYAASTNKIYLSDKFLNASTEALADVILDQIGDWVYAQVSNNTQANERQRFSALVQQQSAEQLTQVQVEDAIKTTIQTAAVPQFASSDIIQLTNNIYTDANAQISGNNVVWQGKDSTDFEIYLYNGTSTVQLTNNSYADTLPRISGNNVAWQGSNGSDNEIFFYNGSSTIQLTNNTFDDYFPDISGNKVVWLTNDGTDTEIFFYNVSSIIQLTNNTYNDYSALISGNNVVWRGFDGIDTEIYLYNGVSTIQLTNDTYNDAAPTISGNKVVWEGNGSEIYLYNGTTTIQLTNDTYNDTAPQVDGNNVVWVSYRESADPAVNNRDIYLYNGTSIIPLATSQNDEYFPRISGNNVTWQAYNYTTSKYEIYWYNGSSTVLLSDNASPDSSPQISGSDIVWEASDGSDSEIYLKTTPVTVSITATDSNAGETPSGVIPNPGSFTLTRTGNTANPLTVNYTVSGTATNGTDYISLPGTVTFPANSNTVTLPVNVSDDNIYEGTQTATVTLANGTGYTLDPAITSTVTIADNETQPTIAINDVSIVEGNSGNTNAVFTVSLSSASTQTITVKYNTSNLTAVAGSDYLLTSGTLTFNPGEINKPLPVAVIGETAIENNETFRVNLSIPTNATIADAQGVGTIINDDASVPSITITATDANAAETPSGVTPNPGVFTFTRTDSTVNAISVNYTISGTAANGIDYTNLSGTVTFAAGSSTATINVEPIDDAVYEGAETVIATLASGTGYTIGNANTATVAIADNDPLPTISISDLTVIEGKDLNAVLTVTLSGASSQPVTVNYSTPTQPTFTDTATPGSDYTITAGTFTFNPGQTSQTISIPIPIIDDNFNELNENLTVSLSTSSNATISKATGTVIISDTLQSDLTTTLPNGIENLTLTGSANINGTGNAGNNIITGNSGNNRLDGAAGVDTLVGGLGNDVYVVDSSNETITELINQGVDTVEASVSFSLASFTNVENLTLTGSSNIDAIGNAANNVLTGNSGNNTLNGSNGNDTYQLTAKTVQGTDTIAESANGGIDTLDFSLNTGAVQVNLGSTSTQSVVGTNQKLILSANNAIENARGANLDDRIIGNVLNNILTGLNGNDQLFGRAGDDNLNGGTGNDLLYGGDGVDLLTGMSGDDILTGNNGNDSFIFNSGAAFTSSGMGVDFLTDFTPGADNLVLSKTTFTGLTSIIGNGFSQTSDFAVVSDDALAATSNALIVYSTNSGSIYYNQNRTTAGFGTGAEFVSVVDAPMLTTADFIIQA